MKNVLAQLIIKILPLRVTYWILIQVVNKWKNENKTAGDITVNEILKYIKTKL